MCGIVCAQHTISIPLLPSPPFLQSRKILREGAQHLQPRIRSPPKLDLSNTEKKILKEEYVASVKRIIKNQL
jgi:hypothetical protein